MVIFWPLSSSLNMAGRWHSNVCILEPSPEQLGMGHCAPLDPGAIVGPGESRSGITTLICCSLGLTTVSNFGAFSRSPLPVLSWRRRLLRLRWRALSPPPWCGPLDMDVLVPRTVRTSRLEEVVPWLVLTDGREEVVPWLILTTDGCEEVVPWLVLTDRTRATGGGTTLPPGCGNLTFEQVLEEGLAWSLDLSPRLGTCNLHGCSLASELLIYWRIQSWSHTFLDFASCAATFIHRLSKRPRAKRTWPSKASSRLSKLCRGQCPSWSTTSRAGKSQPKLLADSMEVRRSSTSLWIFTSLASRLMLIWLTDLKWQTLGDPVPLESIRMGWARISLKMGWSGNSLELSWWLGQGLAPTPDPWSFTSLYPWGACTVMQSLAKCPLPRMQSIPHLLSNPDHPCLAPYPFGNYLPDGAEDGVEQTSTAFIPHSRVYKFPLHGIKTVLAFTNWRFRHGFRNTAYHSSLSIRLI